MLSLVNLGLLKEDMEKKDWVIYGFNFEYKQCNYAVLVKRFIKDKIIKVNNYALVKLQFIDLADMNRTITYEANRSELIVNNVRRFREFFHIEYEEHGKFFTSFYTALERAIPTKVLSVSNELRGIIVRSLSKSDSEDPNKIYCYGMKHNPIGMKRSSFNSNKTMILRPRLFNLYKDDTSISFCYSDNKEDNKTDAVIIQNFNNNSRN